MQTNKQQELLRALKFTIFSVSAGIIEAVAFALLNELTAWPYWPCYLIALAASVVWNFTLNRRYTFRSTADVPRAMALVAAFYCVFTPVTTILGNYLVETLGWNEYLVTALNMACNLVTEYLYDAYVVFRDSIDTNAVAQKAAAEK
ncbi:MAG: GtrA family protein [Oscillospiraceae bacterium]|nr:GtrA family protein [Oscillospiraceae bacterium]